LSQLVNCTFCNVVNRVDSTRVFTGREIVCGACSGQLVFNPHEVSKHTNLSKRKNFIYRHWEGDFSLVFSYWVISFLSNLAVLIISRLIESYVDFIETFNPFIIWFSTLSLIAFIIPVSVWSIVGTWRSADKYSVNSSNKSNFWGSVAKVFLIVSFFKLLAQVPDTTKIFIETSKIAFLNDPEIPNYELRLSADKSEILIRGGFKYGLSKDVGKLIKSVPEARFVILESSGGRIGVAVEVAELISQRKLITKTNSICLSACTIAFLAGEERILGSEGRLGFHAGSLAGIQSNKMKDYEYEVYYNLTSKNGTSASFVKKILDTPHDKMWYPERDFLFREKIITSR
jgi:hypothetical protein